MAGMPEPSGTHTREVQAEAYKRLMIDGASSLQAARELDLAGSTLRRWRLQWSNLDSEELRDNEHVIALRAQELAHKCIDAWHAPDVTPKDLRNGTVAINALRGTAVDKATGGAPTLPQSGPFIIALFPGQPAPDTTPTVDVQHSDVTPD